jgi:chitinase
VVSISASNSEVCVGGTSIITALITGGSSGMILQWQSSTDNFNWNDIPGANSTSYNAPTSSPGTTYYRIVITDPLSDCSDPVSTSVSVLVQPDATVSLSPVTSEVCIGGTHYLRLQ